VSEARTKKKTADRAEIPYPFGLWVLLFISELSDLNPSQVEGISICFSFLW
jgi:hypothetical protein